MFNTTSTQIPTNKGAVTVSEAAQLLGVVPETIRRQIHKGSIQAFRLGTHLRITVEELQRIRSGK
jgi:excisionase family DNA binding protein